MSDFITICVFIVGLLIGVSLNKKPNKSKDSDDDSESKGCCRLM